MLKTVIQTTVKATLCASMLISMSALHPSSLEAAVINGVDFTRGIYASDAKLPTAYSPVWTLNGSPGLDPATVKGTLTIANNMLTFNTPGEDASKGQKADHFYQLGSTYFNPTAGIGATVEFKLKVDSVASDASFATAVAFLTGQASVRFSFTTTSITFGTATYTFDTTEWHTYRIVLDGDFNASLYIDNSPDAVLSGIGTASAAASKIYFGAPGKQTGGVAHYEYIAFTTAGAYAPIPEPGVASLALVSAATAFAFTLRRPFLDKLQRR